MTMLLLRSITPLPDHHSTTTTTLLIHQSIVQRKLSEPPVPVLLELLKESSGKSDIGCSCAAVRSTDGGPLGAKAEVELDVTLNATAGFVVFTPKALPIPVLQKILEGML